jgi:hypothetical protein
MKSPFHVAVRGLVLAMLLLGGCLSNPEPPTPANSPQTAGLNVEALKKAILDKHYDQQLVQPVTNQDHTKGTWTWTPMWTKTVQKRAQDTIYTYVPLEAHLEIKPYVVTLAGCRRYLLAKSTSRGLEFSTVLYVYNEPKAGAQTPFNLEELPYFTNFTGTTLVKNMSSGEQSCFSYLNGTRQRNANRQKPQTGQSGSKTSGCIITYVCEWTGYCAEATGGVTWQVYTSGVGGCPEPSGGACYLSMSWSQSGAWTDVACDGNGGDDGGCGTCGGDTGGGPGSTGPDPNSPCGKMYTLGNQPAFRDKGNTLIGLLNGRDEVGYIYRNNGINNTDYTSIAGGPTSIGGFPPPFLIDGHIHIHNLNSNNQDDGALSIFSMDDIALLYAYEKGSYMNDPASFTLTTYTAFGVDYAIKISDLNAFRAFGTDQFVYGGADAVAIINQLYLCTSCRYPMGEGLSKEVNERNFLNFLKEMNTGLTLFKHERTLGATDAWQQLGLDYNNQPYNVPCQ